MISDTNSAGSIVQHAKIHLLYHELRPSRTDYSYVTGTELFRDHIDFYAELTATANVVQPVITFDDGHVSNYEYAAPILASRNLTAHFFLTVGWIENRVGFMNWSQVRALHDAGHFIGAHGWSHIFLNRCSPAMLDNEILRARLTLEDHLGAAVTAMSLPGGRANRRVFLACRAAGYHHVYTSVPQISCTQNDFTIGRLNIRASMSKDRMVALFSDPYRSIAHLRRTQQIKSTAQSVLGDRLYFSLWRVMNRKKSDDESSALKRMDDSSHLNKGN